MNFSTLYRRMKKQALYNKASIFFTLCITLIFGFIFIKIIFGQFTAFLPNSFQILGFGEEKQYLILLQNNYEIRPTGGFISAYGILSFHNGWPSLEIKDSYSLTNTENLDPLPYPFTVFFQDTSEFTGWFFWDSNVKVSFPEAAQDIEEIFWKQYEGNIARKGFDGVIAVNFEFLENLVDTLEGVDIERKTLTKHNLFSFLQHEVKNIDTHNIDALANRKNILKTFGNSLIKEVVLSPLTYKALRENTEKALQEKQIQIFFKAENLQNKISERNWDGSFSPEKYENYVYANTTNIGGRKADRYMEKHHDYFVEFINNRGYVKHNITYSHRGSFGLNSDVYQAYERVFIPSNTSIGEPTLENPDYPNADYGKYNNSSQESQNYPSNVKIDANTNFIGFPLQIFPTQSQTVELQYELPKSITPKNFTLDILKQPGAHQFWTVTLQMPNDHSFGSQPGTPQFNVKDNVGVWRGEIDQDTHFAIDLIPDTISPLIVWQKFIDIDTIQIHFSEEIDDENIWNTENISITDLNFINESTDNIQVKSVKADGNSLIVEVDGITRAQEERYAITLTDFHDISWNYTTPNPLTVTLVQRIQ